VRSAVVSENDLIIGVLCTIVHRRLTLTYDQPADNKRNKSVVVAESILSSIKALRKEGTEPTFNAVLEYLSSRRILSNHRSLRAYLDIMVKSGLLSLRKEPVKQPNVRPRQVYSITGSDPLIEAGERAMLFHGLNWTLPSRSSIKTKTDIEGLVRARIEHGTLYGSLEDATVETLAKTKNSQRVFRALTFGAAMLATRKLDHGYLMQRAKEKQVEDLVQGLLDEISYLLNSPKPEVDDIRTLYEIRNRLVSQRRTSLRPKSRKFPLSADEMVDVIGKQLGVK
jgi:hypothetical protein